MLIAVDGIYSAGKSTLIASLVAELRRTLQVPVLTTEWNSSDLLGDRVPGWKRDGRLGAHSLLFVEAADLAHRYESVVGPHLDAGGVVVADRYVLSGIARSTIRGVDAGFAARVFDFAPREAFTVLVESPPELTLERRKRLGKHLGGYHSGRDFRRSASVEADFVWYQGEMQRLYRTLAAGRGDVVTVDSRCDTDTCTGQVLAAALGRTPAAHLRAGRVQPLNTNR